MGLNKELVAATAEPLVLSILSRKESYGYAIIKEVQALSRGKINWTEGMLYPVLHRLEHRGLIKATWKESETGRRRRCYSIQKKGLAQLNEQLDQWDLAADVLAASRGAA